jgi:hypothetical protein
MVVGPPPVDRGSTFALECYCLDVGEAEIAAALARLAEVNATPGRASGRGRCLVFPDDDTIFFLLDAPDAGEARRLASCAGISPTRVARCHITEAGPAARTDAGEAPRITTHRGRNT